MKVVKCCDCGSKIEIVNDTVSTLLETMNFPLMRAERKKKMNEIRCPACREGIMSQPVQK